MEELNALLAQGHLKKIEAPMLYASGVQMMMTGNDVTLIF